MDSSVIMQEKSKVIAGLAIILVAVSILISNNILTGDISKEDSLRILEQGTLMLEEPLDNECNPRISQGGAINYIGDVNCDGSIGGPDLDAINGIIGGFQTECIPISDCSSLDLNGDGSVGGPDYDIVNAVIGGFSVEISLPNVLELVSLDQESKIIVLRTIKDTGIPISGIRVCIGPCEPVYAGNELYNVNDVLFNKQYDISNPSGEVTFRYEGSPGTYNIEFKTLGSDFAGVNVPEITRSVILNICGAGQVYNPTTGLCETPCIPSCTNKCLGWSDGCGGICPANEGAICINPEINDPGNCKAVECISDSLRLYFSFNNQQKPLEDLSDNPVFPSSITSNGVVYCSSCGINGGAYTSTGEANYKIRVGCGGCGMPAKLNGPYGTLNIWVKTDGNWGVDGGSEETIIKGSAALISSVDSATNFGYLLAMRYDGKVYAQNRGGVGPVSFSLGTNNLFDNQWHNIAYTYSKNAGETNRIYVDGYEEGSGVNSAGWGYSGNSYLYIADSVSLYMEEFAGTFDEVRVYNRQLNPLEIKGIVCAKDPAKLICSA